MPQPDDYAEDLGLQTGGWGRRPWMAKAQAQQKDWNAEHGYQTRQSQEKTWKDRAEEAWGAPHYGEKMRQNIGALAGKQIAEGTGQVRQAMNAQAAQGGANPMAARSAMYAGAQMGQESQNRIAQMALQGDIAANQLALQQRGQDLGLLNMQQQLIEQERMRKQQEALAKMGISASGDASATQTGMQGAGAAMAAIGAGIGMGVSDVRAKEDIAPASPERIMSNDQFDRWSEQQADQGRWESFGGAMGQAGQMLMSDREAKEGVASAAYAAGRADAVRRANFASGGGMLPIPAQRRDYVPREGETLDAETRGIGLEANDDSAPLPPASRWQNAMHRTRGRLDSLPEPTQPPLRDRALDSIDPRHAWDFAASAAGPALSPEAAGRSGADLARRAYVNEAPRPVSVDQLLLESDPRLKAEVRDAGRAEGFAMANGLRRAAGGDFHGRRRYTGAAESEAELAAIGRAVGGDLGSIYDDLDANHDANYQRLLGNDPRSMALRSGGDSRHEAILRSMDPGAGMEAPSPSANPEDETLEGIKGYTYQYKPEARKSMGLPGGTQYGVMAQDLEATPLGRHMVRDTPGGKAIDMKAATGGTLAMLGRLAERDEERERRAALRDALLSRRLDGIERGR